MEHFDIIHKVRREYFKAPAPASTMVEVDQVHLARLSDRDQRHRRAAERLKTAMKARFEADGDVIVVTGGANGIGRALALRRRAAGARVVVCDVDEAAMERRTADMPAYRRGRLDVCDRDAVIDDVRGDRARATAASTASSAPPRSSRARWCTRRRRRNGGA